MDDKELDVWIQARGLVKFIYVLTSRIGRCAISVSSNIAEGCGRQTSKETTHFLHIARGSLFELETQSILASDLKYISSEINNILSEVERVEKLLNGFINYHKKL